MSKNGYGQYLLALLRGEAHTLFLLSLIRRPVCLEHLPPMRVIRTLISDVPAIEPKVFEDNRGFLFDRRARALHS